MVENKFCPNCGQKNEDTRKTFHHLFVHFFEDLTHYENAFWRTIRNLLLKSYTIGVEADCGLLVEEFIESHEFCLAFEQILLDLENKNLNINLEIFNEIKAIGNLMSIEESEYVPWLEKLVIPTGAGLR